jgi:hypothetical protein
MQRLLAFLLIGLLTGTTSIIGLGVPAAEACTIECIALGRAAFAVFNQQLVGARSCPAWRTVLHPVRATTIRPCTMARVTRAAVE